MMRLFHATSRPALRRHKEHTDDWRIAVAEYYGASRVVAKEIQLRSMYGCQQPAVTSPTSPRVLFFAAWESANANSLRIEICAAEPELLHYFATQGAPPPASTMFYALSKTERGRYIDAPTDRLPLYPFGVYPETTCAPASTGARRGRGNARASAPHPKRPGAIPRDSLGRIGEWEMWRYGK